MFNNTQDNSEPKAQVKLCVDCFWHAVYLPQCRSPANTKGTSLVTGNPIVISLLAHILRTNPKYCGPTGVWWEQLPVRKSLLSRLFAKRL